MKKIMSKGSYRPTVSYGNRIKRSSVRKGTKTILALDPPYSRSKTIEEIIKIVREYESYICAVKINFHMLLSYSPENIRTLNTFVHSYGIQSIADIKLNDIMNSNSVILNRLHRLEFDCLIANPIMGKDGLVALVELAHHLNMGVISLVYMSTPYAVQTYGLNVLPRSNGRKYTPKCLFNVFLDYSIASKVDGIVVGATQIPILKIISRMTKLPIYSPGVRVQGGDMKKAIASGTSYLIVGRSVFESKDPTKFLHSIKNISNISS